MGRMWIKIRFLKLLLSTALQHSPLPPGGLLPWRQKPLVSAPTTGHGPPPPCAARAGIKRWQCSIVQSLEKLDLFPGIFLNWKKTQRSEQYFLKFLIKCNWQGPMDQIHSLHEAFHCLLQCGHVALIGNFSRKDCFVIKCQFLNPVFLMKKKVSEVWRENSGQTKAAHPRITCYSGHSNLNWMELSLETVLLILQVNFQAPGCCETDVAFFLWENIAGGSECFTHYDSINLGLQKWENFPTQFFNEQLEKIH